MLENKELKLFINLVHKKKIIKKINLFIGIGGRTGKGNNDCSDVIIC